MRIVIIIPTLNEVESARQLIPQLSHLIEQERTHQISVLFVDGQSTDGTAQVVEEFKRERNWIQLIVEKEKRGIGAAYAYGMRHAVQELRADFLLEFDGDLQHRVSDIPKFIAKIDEGYDYVVGSRFIPGGSIPAQWDFVRKFLSVGGNILARTVLNVATIRDVTSGFKLARVAGFMDKFDFERLYSKRYAYKIHLLYYMVQRGAKVVEVPIVFEERHGGESKLVKNDIFETLRVLFLLRTRGA